MLRSLVFFALIFIVSLPVFAIDDAPRFEESDCEFQEPAGAKVDCGYLIVPENRNDPDSATIRIAVAILRNPNEDVEDDPIIYLEGGPGGSALKYLYLVYEDRYESLFATNRDIIVFDQRGVGLSEPALDCPDYNELSIELADYEYEGEEISLEEGDALLQAEFLACGEDLASEYDLSGYNTIENAADVEALRIALDYEEINLWGISYGTRLALGVMRDYPEHIRSVVIDSVYTPDVNLYTDNPSNFVRALEVLFDTCEANADCNEIYPNLQEIFFETAAALNEEPAVFDATNSFTGEIYQDIVFDGYSFVNMIFQLLYDTDSLSALPKLIYDAHDGNFGTFQIVVGSVLAQIDSISSGMNMSVQCNEELAFVESGEIDSAWADFPELEEFTNPLENGDALLDACEAFASGEAPETEQDPIFSDIPTLITTGEFDPVTPPAWGELAAETLSNSAYINFPYTGHGATAGAGCAQDIAIEFFLNPEPENLDSSCVDDISISFSGTADFEVDFIPFDMSDLGIEATTLVPEGWDGQGVPGLFARMESSLDLTLIQFVIIPVASDLEAMASTFEESLGLDLDALEVYQTSHAVWNIYPISLQGNAGFVGLTIADRKGVIVLMLGDEEIYDTVFLTVLDAFEPAD